MKNFVLTTDSENYILSEKDNNRIYVFENVNEYKEELIDMINNNQMSISEITFHVESWGGKLHVITLRELLKNFFEKKLSEGVPN